MRTVRIWFRKIGTTRFISHLDLTRCMSRAIHRAKIPLWYTQGFNPRALLTFALPLSLGVAGERESVDIKLEDDNLSNEELLERLNAAMPDDLPVFAVTDPVMKPGKIAYASFVMTVDPEGRDAGTLAQQLTELFHRDSLVVPKHTKSGFIDFDIRPYPGPCGGVPCGGKGGDSRHASRWKRDECQPQPAVGGGSKRIGAGSVYADPADEPLRRTVPCVSMRQPFCFSAAQWPRCETGGFFKEDRRPPRCRTCERCLETFNRKSAAP